MSSTDLSEKEKGMLFWASFLALMAAGVGFVLRGMIPNLWAESFKISLTEVGGLAGAALWPIAITMIIFSLLVDKIGYKISMFFAFLFQAVGVVLTIFAKDVNSLWWACFCAGLGHGVVEAVINPLCASIYREEKSKWLNILHASWPAGIVLGGVAYILLIGTGPSQEELALGAEPIQWVATKWIFWINVIPVICYGIMFFLCNKFPVDERVEAGVSYGDMMKEFGGLGIGLAATFLIYEILNQFKVDLGEMKLLICILIGAVLGTITGFILKSKGKWMFFILCLIMIPLATAEIATDGWIRTLMEPIMGKAGAAWAIVFSAAIMMALRFFAGVPLKYMNPPQLLLLSSVFSIVGLFALSATSGVMIFAAFVLYAIGQTFYWPTVLGFVSEQFPKGGAMTLNTVSAMGLLTVGIFGFPFLGAVQDSFNAGAITKLEPAIVETVKENDGKSGELAIYSQKDFLGFPYDAINAAELKQHPEVTPERALALDETLKETSQSSLKVAAVLPAIMAVAFLLIMVYYRSTGGYKPVVLEDK